MAKVEIDNRGTKRYYDDKGYLHRDDGPAQIVKDGTKYWYINGIDDSFNDQPAERFPNGEMIWLKDHNLHRNDRPALMFPNGYTAWHDNGEIVWPKL